MNEAFLNIKYKIPSSECFTHIDTSQLTYAVHANTSWHYFT